MKKLRYSSVGIFFLIAAFGVWMYWASATPQDNYAMSQTQVARNTYDPTYGAEQITILAQVATTPQTNYGLSLTQIERNKYNQTYGANQVVVSTSTGLQIPFINTTSLTEGDLIYYDSTGEEWDNTQGQIGISGIGSSPAVTLENPTHEDTDGGRESALIIKGQQSGGESANLAKIQGSHDGTSDDTNGDLIFYTNNGTSLTEAMRLDSNQNLILPQEDSPTAPTLAFGDSDTGIYESAEDTLSFATSGLAALHINGSQFVGVGTDSPVNNLFVATSSSVAIPTNQNIASSAGGVGQVLHNTSNSAVYSGIGIETRTSGAARALIGLEWTSSYVGDLFVRLRDSGTTSKEPIRIKSSGELTAAYGIVPAFKTADPCGSGFPEGAIFYNDTANTWCGCDGSNDVKLSDGSACF